RLDRTKNIRACDGNLQAVGLCFWHKVVAVDSHILRWTFEDAHVGDPDDALHGLWRGVRERHKPVVRPGRGGDDGEVGSDSVEVCQQLGLVRHSGASESGVGSKPERQTQRSQGSALGAAGCADAGSEAEVLSPEPVPNRSGGCFAYQSASAGRSVTWPTFIR